tara:strand:+ start:1267 stop:1761 length:495 start_codon:yes stop_codon:yes gene_type:complete
MANLGAVLIDSYENAGSVSSIVLNGMNSSYKFYELYALISPSGANNRIRLQESGTSNTSAIYGRRLYFTNARYGSGHNVDDNDTSFRIQHYQGGAINIHLQIFNSQVSSTHTQLVQRAQGQYGGYSQANLGALNFQNNSSIDGIEFFEGGGANLNGYFYLYGYK